jgi:hypothetical protein
LYLALSAATPAYLATHSTPKTASPALMAPKSYSFFKLTSKQRRKLAKQTAIQVSCGTANSAKVASHVTSPAELVGRKPLKTKLVALHAPLATTTSGLRKPLATKTVAQKARMANYPAESDAKRV